MHVKMDRALTRWPLVLCLIWTLGGAVQVGTTEPANAAASASQSLTGFQVVYRASSDVTSNPAGEWTPVAAAAEGAAAAKGFRIYPRVEGRDFVIFVPMKLSRSLWRTRFQVISQAVVGATSFTIQLLEVLSVHILHRGRTVSPDPRAGAAGLEFEVYLQSTRHIERIANRLLSTLGTVIARKTLVSLLGTNVFDVVVFGRPSTKTVNFILGYVATAASVSTNQVTFAYTSYL